MFSRAEEKVVFARQRRVPVCERHLEHRVAATGNEERFNADVAGWIVESKGANSLQIAIAGEPTATREPVGQQLELRRNYRCLMQQSHLLSLGQTDRS
jgi:hypothetical protein